MKPSKPVPARVFAPTGQRPRFALGAQGSALVETCLSLTCATLLVLSVLGAGYFGFVKIWVRHASYEAAICLASDQNVAACRKELQQTLTAALARGSVGDARLVRDTVRAQVSFNVRLVGGMQVKESRILRLPLRPPRGRAHARM